MLASDSAYNEQFSEHRELQQMADDRFKRMYFRASFHPKTVKLLSLLDVPDRRRPYQPLPTEEESF
jgi:hypothetical protein